jgi:Ca2+-transporting ATPase
LIYFTHTGDNIHTAKHIARECGILPEGSDYIALEGPVFRRMSEEELKEMLPRMRVSEGRE